MDRAKKQPPRPCFSRTAASGTVISMKGDPPRDSTHSRRASSSGGPAPGEQGLAITTCVQYSPWQVNAFGEGAQAEQHGPIGAVDGGGAAQASRPWASTLHQGDPPQLLGQLGVDLAHLSCRCEEHQRAEGLHEGWQPVADLACVLLCGRRLRAHRRHHELRVLAEVKGDSTQEGRAVEAAETGLAQEQSKVPQDVRVADITTAPLARFHSSLRSLSPPLIGDAQTDSRQDDLLRHAARSSARSAAHPPAVRPASGARCPPGCPSLTT